MNWTNRTQEKRKMPFDELNYENAGIKIEKLEFVEMVKEEPPDYDDEKFVIDTKKECDICGYTNQRPCKIVEHMRIHTGEKPFRCAQCDFQTSLKHSLKLHMMVHVRDIKYKCDKCQFSTHVSVYLQKHMKKHGDVDPFKCSYCDFTAVTKFAIQLHVTRNHIGRDFFKCGKCDFTVASMEGLDEHSKEHADVKLSHCKHCDFKTQFKQDLARHIAKMHYIRVYLKCKSCDFKTLTPASFIAHTLQQSH